MDDIDNSINYIYEIYNMELHDEIHLYVGTYVMRVPGGWIYYKNCENGSGGFDMTSVFVPFNNEFMEVKK